MSPGQREGHCRAPEAPLCPCHTQPEGLLLPGGTHSLAGAPCPPQTGPAASWNLCQGSKAWADGEAQGRQRTEGCVHTRPSAGISQQTEGWKAWADEQSGLLNWAQTLITSTLRPSTAEGNAKAKGCVLGQPGRALHQSPQLPCLLHQTPPFSPQFLAAAGLEGQSPRLRQSQAHVASPSPGGLCCGPRDASPAQG